MFISIYIHILIYFLNIFIVILAKGTQRGEEGGLSYVHFPHIYTSHKNILNIFKVALGGGEAEV